MSKKKKKQTSRSGIYAMSITTGLILGMGLSPLAGEFVLMTVAGAAAGALAGYLIDRNSRSQSRRRHS